MRVPGLVATTVLWVLAASAQPAVAGATPPDVETLSAGASRSFSLNDRLAVGMKFDTPVRALRPGEAPIDPVLAHAPPVPTLRVGLRSVPVGTAATADSLIERATGSATGSLPERRVGLEWKPAPSRIFLNRGVGIRLDSDDRLTMRLKKGSLGLFVQTAF